MKNRDRFTSHELVQIYEDMLMLRRFEEKAAQLYGMGLIGGFCHLYIGQEAVAVGIAKAIQPNDTIITSYRDHGFMLSVGSCPKKVMSELLGKETGCSKGKGGSMHMFDIEKRFYGGHGIVGAQVSLGTGIAFAHKYNNSQSISVTIYGDGASHQGQVYESFNMAKLWKLPVLYIIENNEYAMGTSVNRSSSTINLYKRANSFGIESQQVDGMDFFEVYNAVQKACNYIKMNDSPYLLEFKTYRYRGHSMSDPGQYRTKDEIENYKSSRDPINWMKHFILKETKSSDQELGLIDKKIKRYVAECAEYALNSAQPSEDQLYTHVYKEKLKNES